MANGFSRLLGVFKSRRSPQRLSDVLREMPDYLLADIGIESERQMSAGNATSRGSYTLHRQLNAVWY